MANDNNAALVETVKSILGVQAISDEIFDAMLRVDRGLFVPQKYSSLAYNDTQIPISSGVFMQPPSIISLMLNMAKIRPGLNVLEIGTCTGYSTAIISELVQSGKVTSVEQSFEMYQTAKKNIQSLQRVNNKEYSIELVFGDVSLGYWSNGPYDVLISNYASKELPLDFVKQLKLDGRAIIPIGDSSSQMLLSYEKITNTIYTKPISVRFPLLK